ncbi:GNAT family N-acetyltransferase [Proteobacteria bacterium 005FR1]|nr:GNAT family N-acetyltransferase [Proteobacteria bacterium 005FR1]
MEIRQDDLSGPEIVRFLQEHIDDMRSISPPESKHALDLNGLRKRDVTFWTVWQNGNLVGCGALKQLDAEHGEIKSMRSAASLRGQGVGSRMLSHIIDEAQHRSYARLSLETGSMPFFAPAHALYRKFGFSDCEPFGDYRLDPYSVFMTKVL